VVAATCESKGYTVHTCSGCGYEYRNTYTAMLKHEYNYKVVTPATYTTTGVGQYTCKNCNDSYQVELDILALKKPTISSIKRTVDGTTLTWSKVDGATSYEVLRGTTTAEADMKVVKTTTALTYTNTSGTTGTKYYYRVRAIIEVDGETVNSGVASAYKGIIPVKAPEKAAATNTAAGIQLTWSKVEGADGYVVKRKAGTGSWKVVGTIEGEKTTSYVDKDVTQATKYQYQVLSYVGDDDVRSLARDTVVIVCVNRPAISSVKADTSKLTVKWKRNAKVTGYELQYSTSKTFASGNKTVTYTGTDDTVSKTISKLTSDKTYYVRLRAYKTVDGVKYYSAWSVVKNAKVK